MKIDKKKLPILIAGLFVLFIVLAVGGVELSSQPGFCNTCHSMKIDYKTWENSKHKDISCLKCHAEPGIVGLVKVKMGGVHQLWVTVTGNTPEKIVAEVPNSRCLQCHEKLENPKSLANLKFDHAKHIKVNNCTDCHAKVVHNEKPITSSDIKSNCVNCHTKKNVKVEQCADCHKPTHDEKFKISHSASVKKSTDVCMACHAKQEWAEGIPGVGKNFCQNCHQVSMPHKVEFIKNHGQEYDKNQEACVKCHNSEAVKAGSKAKNCISCHKVEMPHEKGFIDKHFEVYKKNPTVCTACHNAAKEKADYKAKNCATCHSKVDVHKSNWKAVHPSESKKSNAACTTCHNTSNKLGFKAAACRDCHSKLNVHSYNWQGKHYSASKKAGANCTSCHSYKGKSLGFRAKTCYECHNQGHSNGYIKVHEAKYKARAVSCLNCHKSSGIANTCNSCHKVNMPHPSNWDKSHGATAKTNKTSCNYCHTSKNPVNPKASYAKSNYCTSCHSTTGGHASNWLGVHGSEAKKTSTVGSACATCHKVSPSGNYSNGFCYNCHKNNTTSPHQASWNFDHMNATNVSSCKLCHVSTSTKCTSCHGAKW